jgi:hypothetical protein
LVVEADSLLDGESGEIIDADEIIGDRYDPGCTCILQWRGEKEEEIDHTVVLHYCLKGNWNTIRVDGELTFEEFMAQNHEDIHWTRFVSQDEELDARASLECYCEETMHLELEIESQEEESNDDEFDLWELRRAQEKEEEYIQEEILEEEELNEKEEKTILDDITNSYVGTDEFRSPVECNRGVEYPSGRNLHDLNRERHPEGHQEFVDCNLERDRPVGHRQEPNQVLGENSTQIEDSGSTGLGNTTQVRSGIPIRLERRSSERSFTGVIKMGEAQRESSKQDAERPPIKVTPILSSDLSLEPKGIELASQDIEISREPEIGRAHV